jgi:hypothetical protein
VTSTVEMRRPAKPNPDAPMGTCRWCLELVLDDDGNVQKRRRWHQVAAGHDTDCLDEYLALCDPRAFLWKRDRGVCAECGIDTEAERERFDTETADLNGLERWRAQQDGEYTLTWEGDHRHPLIDGGEHVKENLQTLCTPCHKAKTAREARARARRSREAAAGQVVLELAA